jgi:hypothetical protein
MNDKDPAARCEEALNEPGNKLNIVLIVHADAVLDCHGNLDRCLHGSHGMGHQVRLTHQTGPKRAPLHPLARTATI